MRVGPILMSAPMVLATLDGRKTQTRRVLTPQPTITDDGRDVQWRRSKHRGCRVFDAHDLGHRRFRELVTTFCPYGRRGDLLWVRETVMFVGGGDPGYPLYRATWREDAKAHRLENVPATEPKGWTPAIHMPRWASRLTLRIADVRVERLQDISEDDAKAEGAGFVCEKCGNDLDTTEGAELHWQCDDLDSEHASHREGFRRIWSSINGDNSWSANPWNWVLTFEVVHARVGNGLRPAA